MATAMIVGLAMTSACGSDPGGTTADETGPLRILAAASLTDAMTDLVEGFEQQMHGDGSDVNVELNIAGSATLREQLLAGAPADVFASANSNIMAEVAATIALEGEPVPLASTSMILAMPAGNPAGITGLADLANDELLIGLCSPGVPCGDFATEVLTKSGVEPEVDTFEDDVRSLLTRITADELDAAIVYSSDIASSDGRVDSLAIPEAVNVKAESQIAALAGSNPNLARAFVNYVTSADGQAVLINHGFDPAS